MNKIEFRKYMLEKRPFLIEEQRAFEEIRNLKKKLEAYKTYFITGENRPNLIQVAVNYYEIEFLIKLLEETENGK